MTNNNSFEINKLYNKLLPSIKRLFNTYNYLDLSQEKFEELTKGFLLDIHNKKGDTKLDDKSYINKLKVYLDVYVKITIKESENTNRIINNYINKKLSLKSNSQENVEELRRFSSFLEKYEYIPSPDTYIEIIKTNKILLSILNQIVENNMNLIESKGIETIDDDSIIISLLEVYCMINNITYDNTDDIELDDNDLEGYDSYSLDTVRTYLREIAKPLLSKEEEQNLAKRIAEGDSSARDKLIEHNLKLVVSIAKRYSGRGLHILDLIQEGNIGLMTAVDRFDYNKNVKFSTYATWWIRQTIHRAITNKSKTIRLPAHMHEQINKCLTAERKLEKELGRTPTIKEIAEDLGISTKKVQEIILCSKDTLSINALISDEDDTELGDFIPSDEKTPEEEYNQILLSEEISKLLQICITKDRDLDIILLRFGFIDGRIHTLEEIGQKYNLTRERIRQIEAKVLNKLRKPKYRKILSEIYLTRTSYKDSPLHTIRSFHPLANQVLLEESDEITTQKKLEPVKKVQKNSNKKIVGILEIFTKEGYTKEEILSIQGYLGQEDRQILELTNGNDLNNPITSEKITTQNIKDYNEITIPRIRTMLKSLYGIKNPCQLIVETIDEKTNQQRYEKKKKNKTQTAKEIIKMKKKRMTIFENLGRYGYTKEEILHIIEKLEETDKELIKLINGNDLEQPVKSENATTKDITKYHTNTIPKILRRLRKEYGSRETEYAKEKQVKNNNKTKKANNQENQNNPVDENLQETPTSNEWPKMSEEDVSLAMQDDVADQAVKNLVGNNEEEIISESTRTVEEPKLPIQEIIESSNEPSVETQQSNNEITKEDYIKILELIKTPTFNELMTGLNPKAAVIIALRLGYVDNKYFSSESIANFLGIEESEVIETTKEILNLYKNHINSFIDKAISYAEISNHTRKLI